MDNPKHPFQIVITINPDHPRLNRAAIDDLMHRAKLTILDELERLGVEEFTLVEDEEKPKWIH